MRPRCVLAAGAVLSLFVAACGGDDAKPRAKKALIKDAVAVYASGVYASYQATLASARTMDGAVDAFVADPTADSLAKAREAWVTARVDYAPTEAFRFYGGPIDDAKTGRETFINAWPLDEAYIDYVSTDRNAGIINDQEKYPVIDDAVLVAANEQGGEANISTGWHAIEFLLWGQDLSEDGPGDRPVADYTTNKNADRRARYLTVTSDMLVADLQKLVDAWAPDKDNYSARFVKRDPAEALTMMVRGVGELGRGELADQRMNVAYEERSQEDEHSCFSDNTTADLAGNATGIEMVLEAKYPGGVSGTSVLDVVAASDGVLARRLRSEVRAAVTKVKAIPAPFDQHIRDGVPDDDPGRASVLAAIVALEKQTDTLAEAASVLSLTANFT